MNSVNTATRGAPSSLEELKELLKNDIKVKVAGSSRIHHAAQVILISHYSGIDGR